MLVSELHEGPCERLGILGAPRSGSEGQHLHSAGPVAEERTQEGGTGVRGEAGPEIGHALRGVDGVIVGSELDLGVGDRRVIPPVIGLDAAGALGGGQRAPEVMPAEQYPRLDAKRAVVVLIQGERVIERRLGARVVPGVAGLARLPHEGRRQLDVAVGPIAAVGHVLLGDGDGPIGRRRRERGAAGEADEHQRRGGARALRSAHVTPPDPCAPGRGRRTASGGRGNPA